MFIENKDVLVLNKSWHPIDSKSLKKAFSTVANERGVFLDTEEYSQHDISSWINLPVRTNNPYINFSTGRIRVPEVLLLSKFNRVPKRIVVFCRRNIWRRDKRKCQYCGCEPTADNISVDHIIPKSKGGLSIFENCVLACTSCNLKKGNKTLQQAEMRLQCMKKLSNGESQINYYENPKHPSWNPLYTLKRKTFPASWKAFLKNIDETLYWEVALEK